MNEDISEILKQFPVAVKAQRLLSWKGKKGTWAVQTDNGLKVLKKCPASRSRQVFLSRAVLHLRRNGAPVPDLVRTREGAAFGEYKGVCYTLSDAVKGRSPEYDIPSELRQILETLGRFHLASRGFTTTSDEEERRHLGRWEQGYQQHVSELASFKTQAARRSDSFSKLFLKHVDSVIAQGNEAVAIVRGSGYHNWVNKVEKQGNLCHQDFASGNLILSAQGMNVIDMDSLTIDLPARDLRKILNKVMKKKGWRAEQTLSMLKAYHSVHPLTADEYDVLKADLLFPHLFYGITSKYYKRRLEADWTEGKPIDRLQAMIRSELSKMNVLNRWDSMIGRVMGKRGGSP